jgi:hypothetical protein
MFDGTVCAEYFIDVLFGYISSEAANKYARYFYFFDFFLFFSRLSGSTR